MAASFSFWTVGTTLGSAAVASTLLGIGLAWPTGPKCIGFLCLCPSKYIYQNLWWPTFIRTTTMLSWSFCAKDRLESPMESWLNEAKYHCLVQKCPQSLDVAFWMIQQTLSELNRKPCHFDFAVHLLCQQMSKELCYDNEFASEIFRLCPNKQSLKT